MLSLPGQVKMTFAKSLQASAGKIPRAIQFYLNYGFLFQDTDATDVVLVKAIGYSNLD